MKKKEKDPTSVKPGVTDVKQPENLPIEEIVINLGFWITMAVNASQRLVREKIGDGVSKSQPDSK